MMKQLNPFQNEFLKKIFGWSEFFGLFDHDPAIYFFIKDSDGKFVWMNKSLTLFLGIKEEHGYVQKTDHDYFSSAMTCRYLEEDRQVIETKKSLINQPWIITNKQGVNNWCLSSKFPIFEKDRNVIGIAGIMRDYAKTTELFLPYYEMREVVEFIFKNYSSKISIEELASMVFLSVSQFERRFRDHFKLTPRDFILKIRIETAIKLLTESDLSVTQIALQTGFYDSSFFTRQFKKIVGEKPLEFRKKYVK